MNDLTRHIHSIDMFKRNSINKHSSILIWMTGLSGSGKSTLANLLEIELSNNSIHTYILDGDNIRLGINKDLTFTEGDRNENIRRVAEIAKLMIDAGLVTIATFISPLQTQREKVREIVGKDNFIEIHVNTPLEECIKRDPKGLYKKAISNEIKDFTGISAPYEEPISPNIRINTAEMSPEDAVELIKKIIQEKITLT